MPTTSNQTAHETSSPAVPAAGDGFDATACVIGAGAAGLAAGYALYRLVRDYLDTRALKQQAEVIKTLVEAGFKPKLAQATVIALLSRTAKRTEDDPVFKKALKLVGEG